MSNALLLLLGAYALSRLLAPPSGWRRRGTPANDGPGRGARLLQRGKRAAEAIAQVLPRARPVTVPAPPFGEVILVPGTVFAEGKMIVEPQPLSVVYAVGDALYEQGTQDFLRSEWFAALQRGAQAAQPLAVLAEAEIALLQGLLVPWYLLLGLAAASLALFVVRHADDLAQALHIASDLLETAQRLKARYPQYFRQLVKSIASDVLSALPQGVGVTDVAFFLGRFVKGAKDGPAMLGRLVGVAVAVAARVAALHLPGVASRALTQSSWSEVQQMIADAGLKVSPSEARGLIQELLQPTAPADLQLFAEQVQAFAPLVERLSADLEPGHA